MTRLRLIGIVSAADKEAARNAIGVLGYGPDCFVRPLVPAVGPDNAEPVAWACDWQPDHPGEWGLIRESVEHLDVRFYNEGTLDERRRPHPRKGLLELLARLELKPQTVEP